MLINIVNFVSQPWLGSLVGIISLIAGAFFFLKSRRITKLAFQRDSVTLVGGSDAAFPDELKIQYSGKDVLQVSSERFAVWNAGNTTISASEIVEADPLRLEIAEKGQVLKVTTLGKSREVNGFRIKESETEKKKLIHFDFLDPNDGFSIEVIHSGAKKDLKIEGTIKGMPAGIKNFGRFDWYSESNETKFPFSLKSSRLHLILMAVIGAGMAAFGLFNPQLVEIFPVLSYPKDQTEVEWALVSFGAVYLATPALIYWIQRKRFPSSLNVSKDTSP